MAASSPDGAKPDPPGGRDADRSGGPAGDFPDPFHDHPHDHPEPDPDLDPGHAAWHAAHPGQGHLHIHGRALGTSAHHHRPDPDDGNHPITFATVLWWLDHDDDSADHDFAWRAGRTDHDHRRSGQ